MRFLKTLDDGLRQAGVPPYKFLIVGDGSEREWLMESLQDAEIPGILRGEGTGHCVREYGRIHLPFPYGYVRQRGAGGFRFQRSSRGDRCRRP